MAAPSTTVAPLPATGIDRFAGWRPSPAVATAAIVGTSVAYAFASFFARQLTDAGISATAVTFFRFAITAVALSPWLPRNRADRSAAVWGVSSGAVMAIGWIAYVQAIATGDVASAGIAYMTYPVFAVAAAALVFGIRPERWATVAAGLVLVGAAIGLGGLEVSVSPWVMLAPASFGFSIAVLTERLRSLDPFARLGCAAAGATIVLTPSVVTAPTTEVLPATTTGWVWILGLGIGAALIPMLIYAAAAPVIGAARAATANAAELPVVFAIGAVFFGEAILVRHGVAALIIIGAILLGRVTRSPHVLPDEDDDTLAAAAQSKSRIGSDMSWYPR